MNRQRYRSRIGLGLLISAAWLSISGCGEDLLADGDPCEKAQDCEGSLSCAYLEEANEDDDEEDARIQVCAPLERTRPEHNCVPGAEVTPCGLVLLRDEGETCESADDCLEELQCTPSEDDGPARCLGDDE